MPRQTLSILAMILITLVFGIPLLAHHSFGAEYDANKPITLTGVVTKIEWTNPHSYFYMDVKDATGSVANWKFEGYPPGVLYRTGWKREVSMKQGDTITVFGWRARDGTNWAHSRQVTLADGKKLFFGPPAGTGDGGNTPSVAAPVAAQ
jgi:V8-like Glu-specific endopeptidase